MSTLTFTLQSNITPLALAFSIVILAVTSSATPTVRASRRPGLIGVSLHSFTAREADLVKLADLPWVRADVVGERYFDTAYCLFDYQIAPDSKVLVEGGLHLNRLSTHD
jgi:hypothetical protein